MSEEPELQEGETAPPEAEAEEEHGETLAHDGTPGAPPPGWKP